MSEGVAEKVLASIVRKLEAEDIPKGWLESAVHEGLLSGFRYERDIRKVKRLIREDSKRLYDHAKDLCEWDVGDDNYTATEIKEIADRLSRIYGLTIVRDDN